MTGTRVVRVGTSGWHYPGGNGTWDGVFYPAAAQQPRGFDALAFYARYFDTVEVNSSFYGLPRATVTGHWAARTPADFRFTVKLHRSFTHPEADVPVAAGAVDAFRRGLEPLATAGKLGALLVQFPPSFRATPEAIDHLAWVLRTFRNYRPAVELRHRSWSDAAADTTALLEAYEAAWVRIDEPKFASSVSQDLAPAPAERTGLYYVRLHGRNAAQWWEHEAAEDRYNYLYAPEELAPVAHAARRATDPEAGAPARQAYVLFNNHFSAKAIANAAELRRQLGDPLTEPLPDSLLARYPELATP